MKCVDCSNVPLKFKDAVGVLPGGICGHLVIRCYNCLRFVQVAMGKTHSSPHGQQIFDVNTKLATGMYHSGIGPVQLNNFFTSMNLPNISESLIRRRCDEVGPVLEDLGEKSTSKALCEEGHLSATSTASLIGKRTGKIVGFSARYNRCRKCDVAKAKHRTPKKHACKKN
uniref:Mutator-like transposase domain-containing protein n=1 Tax=Magallana gigas TaxID=29159 RepID=K1QTA0_MAGGI